MSLQIELPSCLKCHRKKAGRPIHVEEKQVDPATLKLRNEARVAIDACEQLAEKEGLADQDGRRRGPLLLLEKP